MLKGLNLLQPRSTLRAIAMAANMFRNLRHARIAEVDAQAPRVDASRPKRHLDGV